MSVINLSLKMNYSKSTQAPITDAARFFSEKGDSIRFEEKSRAYLRERQAEKEKALKALGKVVI